MTTATARLVRPPTWRESPPAPVIKIQAAFDSEAAELAQLESLLRGLAEVPFAPLAGPLRDALAATEDRVRARVALAVGRALGVKLAYRLALAAALETLYVASQVHEVLTRRANLNGSAGALVLMGDHLYAQAAVFAALAFTTAITAGTSSTRAATTSRASDRGWVTNTDGSPWVMVRARRNWASAMGPRMSPMMAGATGKS